MNSELDDPHTLHLKVHIDDPHVPEDHKSPAGPALRFPGPGAKLIHRGFFNNSSSIDNICNLYKIILLLQKWYMLL